MNLTFDERGEYVVTSYTREQGPLRESPAGEGPPPWEQGDHDPIDIVTLADHRSNEGRIVPAGTACRARRANGVVSLEVVDRESAAFQHFIVLDGRQWAVDSDRVPTRVRPYRQA